MLRYYFHLREADGVTVLRDEVGVDLPNPEAAVLLARDLAQGIVEAEQLKAVGKSHN